MDETLLNKTSTQQLLSLLKAALWEKPVDTGDFKAGALMGENENGTPHVADANWDEIAVMALNQTVGPAVFKSAMSLPADYLPPKEWMRKAYSFLERNRRTHRLTNSCVAEAAKALKRSGIKAVLLKGQAYARFYPDATLRQCGDIDVHVGNNNYRKAYETACECGWESKEEFMPQAKHYGCTLRGIRMELHRVAADLSSPICYRRFQEWSARELDEGRRKIIIDEEEIYVGSPLFETVFVFLHLYHHFIFGGIGLRQVCDWVMILHSNKGMAEEESLRKILKELRLTRAWQFFTPIAVNYLGLPEAECPLYSPKYQEKSKRILSMILKEGNFGRGRGKSTDSIRTKNYYLRKLYILLQFTGMMVPRFRIDPRRSAEMYIRTLSRGGKGLLLHLLKR